LELFNREQGTTALDELIDPLLERVTRGIRKLIQASVINAAEEMPKGAMHR
tara:strand:- start:1950 stop:2102 length:153 start_codon:yes stop_codon:yes gene_type:complete